MLKDNLITKKQYEKKMEELFNKAWYNGYKDWIFEKIQKYLWDDTMYQECSSVINPFIMDKSMDVIQKMDVSFKYKFLRSKLWNEGFNLKIDINNRFYIGLKKDSDTYNDCLFHGLFYSIYNLNYDDLYNLMIATNKTVEEILDFYRDYINDFDKIEKFIKDSGLASPEKIKSKRKNSSNNKKLNSKNSKKSVFAIDLSTENLNNSVDNKTIMDEAIDCAPNEVKEMINEIRSQEPDGE